MNTNVAAMIYSQGVDDRIKGAKWIANPFTAINAMRRWGVILPVDTSVDDVARFRELCRMCAEVWLSGWSAEDKRRCASESP